MRVLVTGATGQLGYDVVKELKSRCVDVVGVGSREMDITDTSAVWSVLDNVQPDAIIHCAGYTAVDAAEEEREECYRRNVDGTRHLVEYCKQKRIKLLYVSTDYVFSGEGESYWKENDLPQPVNFYGQTKYLGEQLVLEHLDKYFIVRISWAFGINGKNFVKTMLRLAETKSSLCVVDDQFGSPTYTKDLAPLFANMILSEKYGIYHATDEGICSWYEFACEIFRQAGKQIEVIPVSSEQYPVKAKRPKNSRLCKDKLEENGFQRLSEWQDALERYLKEIQASG